MPARKGRFAKVWIDGYQLTSQTRDIATTTKYDEIEIGAYNSDAKQYISGRAEGEVAIDGFFDTSLAGTIHEALKTVAADSIVGVAYGNNAAPVIGDIAGAMPVHKTNYTVSSELDGVIGVNATLKSLGYPFEWGVLLADVTGASADGNTTAVDNAALSSNGASAYLFITEISASDTCVFKVQHSTNNSTWVDLITFTANGSAITAERATVAGTVNRYVRVLYDVTDTGVSISFAVIFCRK